MPQKEARMQTTRRARLPFHLFMVWGAVALLITTLGTASAFAWGGGSLLRSSQAKKTHRARDIALSAGARVSRPRIRRHDENTSRPSLPPTLVTPPASPPPDTTPPNTSITSGPAASTISTSASFSFGSGESGSSFECKLDMGGYAACTSPKSYSGLSVGSHQFSVRAKDAANNVDATPAAQSWTVKASAPPPDTTPPDTSIASGPDPTTAATMATIAFSSSESGSGFECKLDAGSWSNCTSPKAYSGLGLGSHKFSARAKDAAGNVDATAAIWSWTVEALSPPPDTTPPDTSIDSGPAVNTTSTSAGFSFSADESGASFECKLDAGSYTTCTSSRSYSGLSVGSHQFSVRATDGSGNVDGTPAVRDWTIETAAPPPPPPTPPPPPAECTSTVTSTSAAQSAVSSASPGSVICLANGTYGRVTLSASKAAPGVTLRAQNPGQATLEGATVGGSHLTLARFVITNGVSIPGSTVAPTIEHNRITGGGQGIDACTTTTDWCTEIRITGNQLVGPFGEDAIHANRYHGLYVEGNEITQVRENGNHSDCLQTVWRGDHIYFRNNYLHDNRCQGFFIKDQTMSTAGIPGGPIEGVVVEDNLFLRNKEPCGPPATSCGQPIYFQPVAPFTGFVMKRNTIWGDGVDSIAAFRGEGAVGSDTLVENNVIYRIWTDWNMTAATLRNNTDCMREASGAGAWSTVTGETKACSLSFANPAADDYRISGERGVDWAPAEVHFGP